MSSWKSWSLIAVAVSILAGVLVLGGNWLAHTDMPRGVPTVGVVQLTAVDTATFEGFKAGLQALGYREGHEIHYRNPGPAVTIDRLDGLIADHLAAGVDLLFVSSTPATLAAQKATAANGVPVVFAPVNDPQKAGIVKSLQAPGGNLTGVRLPQGDAMRVQWLLQVAPGVRHILFPHNPHDQSALESLRQIQALSADLGITLHPQPVPHTEAITASLRALPPGIDAILLPRDSSVEARIDDYVAAATARRLPLCAPSLTQVHAGALLSYGFVHYEIGRQAARLASQILEGVAPADLPVETADSYLAINLKTAQALGLPLPAEILRETHLLVR